METTIRLNNNIKTKLDSFKIHFRESYNDVISRMLEESKATNISEDSLKETIDVLSDPETLKDLAEALNDFEKGKFVELK